MMDQPREGTCLDRLKNLDEGNERKHFWIVASIGGQPGALENRLF